jgi:imidazolonepropionase-like amidohydrolase
LSAADPDPDIMNRPLVQQTVPASLLSETRAWLRNSQLVEPQPEPAKANLLRAWKSGTMLAPGSQAGRPLVFHGPTIQRELELWVLAGIPNEVALQAATANAARLLGAADRFGAIRPGLEATLLIVDGNPVQDIHALSSVTTVILKGERVARGALFDED